MAEQFEENTEDTNVNTTGSEGDTGSETNLEGDNHTEGDTDNGKPVEKEVNTLEITKPKEVDEPVEQGKVIDGYIERASKGELSDTDKQEIEKAGLTKYLDVIVASQQAEIAKNTTSIQEVAGGEKEYSELKEWAVATLSDSEIEAFNDAVVKSGNVGIAKLAVEALKSRYVAANGSAPDKMIEGGGTANGDSRGFSSVDEYIRETMGFEYKSNPEYAAKIEAKRNASGF